MKIVEDEKVYCSHNFEYSHSEKRTEYGYTIPDVIDVVVCTKCGEVRRN